MRRKHDQTQSGHRPDKRAPASAPSKLLTAVSLLGVSLGVSAAATLDGAGPAPSAKGAAAGEKLAESKQIKWIKKPQSNQIKWRNPQSNQIKWRKP
jgi:hypothetical protein